jgi:hypothetical protein
MPKFWNLFSAEPASDTARYAIKSVPFHPCVRRDRRRAQTTHVVGDRAYRDTVAAIRAAGGDVVRVDRSGR